MLIFIEFWGLLGVCFGFMGFFFNWVIWVFFHTAPGTSSGNLEVLNTVLNKCETAPK